MLLDDRGFMPMCAQVLIELQSKID